MCIKCSSYGCLDDNEIEIYNEFRYRDYIGFNWENLKTPELLKEFVKTEVKNSKLFYKDKKHPYSVFNCMGRHTDRDYHFYHISHKRVKVTNIDWVKLWWVLNKDMDYYHERNE